MGLEPDGSGTPTLVVFEAKTKEEAVLAIAEEILGHDEIAEYVEDGEPGDDITDYVPIYILDDYPAIVGEVKRKDNDYENAQPVDMEFWYSSDILPLLEKKYPKKK